MFFIGRTGKLVRIEGMMDGTEYKEILSDFQRFETGMEVHLPAGQ
jgi:hypothetical protein